MKNKNQQGFASVIIVIIILALIGGLFIFYPKATKRGFKGDDGQATTTKLTTTDQVATLNQSANSSQTMDTGNWKTYKDSSLGISFKYPSAWATPTAQSLGSSYAIEISSTTGDLLYVESRSTYNNTSEKIETFDQFVAHRVSFKQAGASYCSRKITINGKEAAELVSVKNIDQYKNCLGDANTIFVNEASGSVLTISNDEGLIDSKTFSSIVTSFVFDVKK